MKIVYCIPSVFNSGGMERILSIKANYLVDVLHYDVTIVTTDQKGRKTFFNFSPKIKFVDLQINYSGKKVRKNIFNIMYRIFKMWLHKKKMGQVLNEIKPDITISLFQHEASFLYSIKDGSKKVIESHFSHDYRKIAGGNNAIMKLVNRYRCWKDDKIVSKYNAFVTLTEEDRVTWHNSDNIVVIPNPITIHCNGRTKLNTHTVIAVGRVTHQKGFDSLVRAWNIVEKVQPDWILKIIGAQDDLLYFEYINTLIKDFKLNNIFMCPPKQNIEVEYMNSDILVLTSLYEGLPLVLIEGMSFGLPCISYACKCGPKDLITDGFNGFLVSEGNYKALANRIIEVIENDELRGLLSRNALEYSKNFKLDKIMNKWTLLFQNILAK